MSNPAHTDAADAAERTEPTMFTLPAPPTISDLQALAPLESFVGFDGISLRVSQRSYAIGTDVDEVIAGRAIPETIIATQDGRHVADGWHEGQSPEEVFYERYEVRSGVLVRVGHGWIDRASRQLVQAG